MSGDAGGRGRGPPDAADGPAPGERYETLANAVADPLFQVDADGRFVAVNDALCETTGLAREELLEASLDAVFPDAGRLATALADPSDATVRAQIRTATDGSRACEIRLRGVDRDGSNGVAGSVRLASDPDEGEHDEGEHDDLQSSLLENFPGMVYRCDHHDDWTMTFVSEGCAELTGHSPEALTCGEIDWTADVVHPDHSMDVFDEVLEAATSGEIYEFTYPIRTTNGETRWVFERGRGVVEDGELAGLEGFVTDMTDHDRTRDRLHEETEKFRSLVDAVDEYAIFMLDPDGRVTSWNEGASRIKGYDADEIIGEHFSTFYTDRDAKAGVPDANLRAATETGTVEDEGWRVRADGSQFWANVTITPVYDDGGDLRGYAKVTRDMTERKERKEALRRERDLVEQLLEANPVGIAVLDAEGELDRLNEAGAAVLGVDPGDDLQPADWTVYDEDGDVVPPREWPQSRTLRTGEPIDDYECELERPDGTRRWLSANVVPLFDADELDRVILTANDITSLKERQAALQRERDLVSQILETNPTGVVLVDEDNAILRANQRSAELVGRTVSEITGMDSIEIELFDEDGEPIPDADHPSMRALAADETVGGEYRVRLPDGEWRWLAINAAPLDDQGDAKIVISTQDVTPLKRQQADLRRERDLVENVIEVSPDMIGVFDADDGDLLRANARAKEFLNVGETAPEEYDYVGGAVSLYDEEGEPVPPAERPFARAIETGEPIYDWQGFMENGDGEGRWFSINAMPVYEDGSVERVVVVGDDVTQLKEQARTLERELGEVFERIDDAFYAVDDQFQFTYVNERAEDLLQHAEEDLLGESVWEVFPQAAETAAWEGLHRALETQEQTSYEVYFPPLDFWVETNVYPSETGLSVYFRDVTDRKEREQELETYETIVETIEDGVYVLDEDFRFEMVNDAYVEMTGYDRERLLGAHASFVVDEDVSDESAAHLEDIVAGEATSSVLEADINRADGGRVRAESKFTAIPDDESETPRKVGVVRDVTERRKREQELEQYRAVAEAASDAIVIIDESSTVVSANPAVADILGYEPADLEDEPITTLMADSMAEAHHEAIERYLRTGEETIDWDNVELPGRHRDGHDVPLAVSINEFEHAGNRYFAGVIRDVTDRKERERALEESRNRYQALVENFPNGAVALVDEDLRYTTVGGTPIRESNATVADLEGRSIEDVLPPEIAEVIVPRYADAIGGERSQFEAEIGDHAYQFSIVPVRNDSGDVFATLGMSQDITERKEREQYLEDAKAQLEAATEAGAVGTWEWHVQEDRFVAGASFAKQFGVDPEEAREGVPLSRFTSSIHEADRERVEADIEAALETCGEYESEYRVRNADGEFRWLVARGHVECDAEGEPVTFPGAVTDITERKRAELQLQRNNEQLESLFEILPIGVVVADADGKFIDVNDTAREIWNGDIFGAGSVEDYEQYSAVWADSGESVEPEEWTMARVLDGEEVTDPDVFEIETADGERQIVSVEGIPVRDASGEVTRGVVTLTDVTERKERERELGEYETMVETVGDGIFTVDADGTFTHVNEAYASMLGYEREELLGRPATAFAAADDVNEEGWTLREQLLDEDIDVAGHEIELETADGGTIPVDVRFKLLPADDGEQPEIVAVVRDVTERKEREQELERYETIVETVNDGIYVVGEDGRFTMVNEEYAAMTGYDPNDLIGRHVTGIVDEETARRARQLEAGLLSGVRDSATLEAEVETADGESIVAEATFALLPAGDGDYDRIGVVRDVTDRKERERALEESERRYRTLAENFPNGSVALFDEDLRYTAAGGQLLDRLGTEPEQVIGDRITERYPDALVEQIEPHFRAALEGETRSFEAELEGWHLFAHTLPVRDADDGVYAGMLVVQDVTELRERERELETRVSQQEAVTALGRTALEERDLDVLFEEVTDRVAEVLDADYCKVLELLPDGEEVLLRSGVGWRDGLVGSATVSTGLDSQAGYTLQTEEPVVVDDLATETRFSGPDLLVDHDVTSGISTALGTPEDPWGVIGVHDTDSREFSAQDINFVQSVATILTTAIQRGERERDLELYETIVETIWDGVYALDPDGNFELVNEAFASMLGYERKQLLGEPASIIHSAEVNATAQAMTEEALEGDAGAATMELQARTAGGGTVPVETRFGPYPYDGERYARTGVSRDVTERLERQRALERQREELAALNRLNQVVGEITHAAIESSSREEIEQLVCERLADSESYRFAWIGELDRASGTVSLRTEAGVEGYLDDVTLVVDPEEGTVGPTGRAARTREPQIVQDTETNADYEPWREHAREYGFQSSAAIPVTYEDVTYGVLNVYSERSGAFDGYERTLLARLGTVVGHAINALERKEALMSDQVVEVEFELPDVRSLVGDSVPIEGTVSFERTVSIGGNAYLQYGTADEAGIDLLEALVSTIPHWEELSVLEERFGEVNFELRLSEPPAISLMAAYGGRIESAVVEDGDYRMTVELPPTADVRAVVEALQEEYAGIELVAQRRTTREAWSAQRIDAVLEESLTDRQRAGLEAAYYAGYFDTPRRRSGEEVAQSLDISAPTLHQHLRKGQRKLLAAVFEGPTRG